MESELGFGFGLGSALADLEDRYHDTPMRGKTKRVENFWRACAQNFKLKETKFKSLRRRLISMTRRTLRYHLSYLKSSLVTLA